MKFMHFCLIVKCRGIKNASVMKRIIMNAYSKIPNQEVDEWRNVYFALKWIRIVCLYLLIILEQEPTPPALQIRS